DIISKIFTGDNPTLDEPLWRAMVRAGFHSGAVYVATDDIDPNPIMSIGVWFGPGNVLEQSHREDQRVLGYPKSFLKLSPECREWM
ncbi:hypothetical protein J3R30DRAFT_3241509, partial [Lentinula aciculospora]